MFTVFKNNCLDKELNQYIFNFIKENSYTHNNVNKVHSLRKSVTEVFLETYFVACKDLWPKGIS